jgi:PmbA protein
MAITEKLASSLGNLFDTFSARYRVQWEIYSQKSVKTDLQLRKNEPEINLVAENTGYGVRVIVPKGEKCGIGFASCNSIENLKRAADEAYEISLVNISPKLQLPYKSKLSQVQNLDPRIAKDSMAVVKEYAEAVSQAFDSEKEVRLSGGKIRTYDINTEILNSEGIDCSNRGSYFYLEMMLKIGEGSYVKEFWPYRYTRRVEDLAPDKTIQSWIGTTKGMMKKGEPIKTGKYTVILSPHQVCDAFVGTIGFHASGSAEKRNLSLLKPGEQVAAEILNIVDDGLYPFGLKTKPFDDEGSPQRVTPIITKGVFENRLYDKTHADMYGRESTGNGIRPKTFGADVDNSYNVTPANLPTNFSILPGSKTLEELVREVSDGVLIHSVAWINPNPATTRWGTEIRYGSRIKSGEITGAVVGGTLSGSTLEMMKRISGLSNKPEIVSSSEFGCVTPYMRIEEVDISGE